jgi:spore coat polysaccharide biosynthesis protein SpsF
MEVGQFKIGAIIQARLGSTRLPNKVLMPLPLGSNETILSQIIKKIKEVDIISDVIVATSKLPINDKLEEYVRNLNIDCFRGEEEDVLSRFYHISQERNFDYVIRFTGDNPIVDTEYLKQFINNFFKKKLEYSYSANLPLGCNFEMMKSSEINKAYKNAENSYDKEHVTPLIKKNANIKECYTFEKIEPNKNLRLTIDYPSDYALMTMIYSLLKNKQKSVKNIFKLIDNNNWIVNINKDNFQKKKYLNIDEEIKDILPLIKERELKRLLELLNKIKNYNN